MKSLIAAFITALVVFILATGWSEVVQPRLDLLAMTTSPTSREKVSVESRSRVEMSIQDGDDDVDTSRRTTKSTRSSRQLREEALQAEKAKAQVAQQLEEVKRQEAKLVAREENLRILYDDIRAELAAIEQIRRQSATELAIAEQKVLDAARTSTVTATNEPGQRKVVNKADKSSQTYIAGLVQDLANRGSIETAAGLLRGMKDREIAKVLTTLSTRDPQLANRLFEQVRVARQDTTIRR